MYLNIGQNFLIPEDEIIGVFDLDNTTWAYKTREFLDRAEREGRVAAAGDDLPKSFVLCGDQIYLTQLNTVALSHRSIPKENRYV